MANARTHSYTRLRRDAEHAAERFPALLASAERIAASVAHGDHGRRRPGIGEAFWEYRHHRAEDGAQSVDWRRSAKGQSLYVRETEWEAANAIYLWRDGREGMDQASPGLHTKRERAAVCLIAVASLLARGGERLATLGEADFPRTGQSGFERCARALADGPGAVSNTEAPELSPHARAVLASDFLDPPETWAHRLKSFAAQGCQGILLRIIDPAEEDFPFTGRTRFKNPSASDDLLFGRAEDARSEYRAAWARHGVALSGLARQMGWTLVTHRTDRPAASAVMALYQALEGG